MVAREPWPIRYLFFISKARFFICETLTTARKQGLNRECSMVNSQ
jgi:hypothetical protein